MTVESQRHNISFDWRRKNTYWWSNAWKCLVCRIWFPNGASLKLHNISFSNKIYNVKLQFLILISCRHIYRITSIKIIHRADSLVFHLYFFLWPCPLFTIFRDITVSSRCSSSQASAAVIYIYICCVPSLFFKHYYNS